MAHFQLILGPGVILFLELTVATWPSSVSTRNSLFEVCNRSALEESSTGAPPSEPKQKQRIGFVVFVV
jgi:hypothetical protein